MQTLTNNTGIPLSIAVFLANDNYDYQENVISVTTLIKPVRQIVLSTRVDPIHASVDVSTRISSAVGSAIHDGFERSWVHNYQSALKALGYPTKVIDRIQINPIATELTTDTIPVYLEQRAYKDVGSFRVSGKFDFVGDGRVEDVKTTSVYTYLNNTNEAKYILQGSLYRWLNPEIITQDEMAIQFIFTDWSAVRAHTDKNYPKSRHLQKLFVLKPVYEIDQFVKQKLSLIQQYMDAPEESIPECTDEDLWRSEPVFKYYKNPDKLARSTKNYDTLVEANLRRAQEGVGVVIERPGQVKACNYCPAYSVCSQKDRLIAQGDLIL